MEHQDSPPLEDARTLAANTRARLSWTSATLMVLCVLLSGFLFLLGWRSLVESSHTVRPALQSQAATLQMELAVVTTGAIICDRILRPSHESAKDIETQIEEFDRACLACRECGAANLDTLGSIRDDFQEFIRIGRSVAVSDTLRGGLLSSADQENGPAAVRSVDDKLLSVRNSERALLKSMGGLRNAVATDTRRASDQVHARSRLFTGIELTIAVAMLGLVLSATNITRKASQIAEESCQLYARIECLVTSLRQSEERFHQLANHIGEVFWITSVDRREIYYLSPACEAVWERSHAELLQDPLAWFDLIHPDDSERVYEQLLGKECAVPFDIEYRVVTPNGSHKWLHDRGFPVRNGSDPVCRIAGITEDISQRKETDAAKRDAERRVRQAQRLEGIGTLAGGIAHEFNNLLQIIAGYAERATKDLPDGNRCRDLRNIQKATEQGAKLTRQLLSFSRQQPLEAVLLDPNILLSDLANMLRPLIGEDICLRMELADEIGVVFGDPASLQQMLMNLCLNARDAMSSDGTLTLRSERLVLEDRRKRSAKSRVDLRPGPYVKFTVVDTGCGISPDVEKRVFEPFFTTKPVGEGTGLGLAMVYGVVQQHGGAIDLSSQPDVGTRIEVLLPEAEGTSAVPLLETCEAAGGCGEVILVAEDEPRVRNLTMHILEEAGYGTIAAENGLRAVELFEQYSTEIALVLLDVIMPKLTGPQARERIRALCPDVAVIFCSGYDANTVESELARSDEQQLIRKPFSSASLLHKVRQVLDERTSLVV